MEKLKKIWEQIREKWKQKDSRRHMLILAGCILLAGIVISTIPAAKTSVNDMPIHYTMVAEDERETDEDLEDTQEEPVVEETAETQEEPSVEETPAETQEEPSVEETPAETQEEPSVEETAETQEEPSTEETVAEPQFLPQVEIKGNMLSTNHRPWVLSHLSDMYRSLQQKQ